MDDKRRAQLTKHTVPFLACLLGCSLDEAWIRPVTFQTFTDSMPKPKPDPLAQVFHGSLDDHAEELDRLNKAGAGVFVTVNGTDLQGRRKTNIIQCRAWWADLDTKDAREPLDLAALPLAPSMVVETPGGWHLYWVATEAMPCQDAPRRAEHEAEVQAIAAALKAYGGDLKACTVERVLRVSGFFHRKGEPRPVRLQLQPVQGARYTRDQVRQAFPVVEIKSEPARRDPAPIPSGSVRPQKWRDRVAAFLKSCDPSIQGSNGSGLLLTTCMKLFTRFGLSVDEVVEQVMEHYNIEGICVPVWSLAEVQHKAMDADKAAGPVRGTAWREDPPAKPKAGKLDRPKPGGAPAPAAGIETPAVPDPAPAGAEVSPAAGRPAVHGFEWGNRGLFHMKPGGKDPDGNEKPPERAWIAPPFTLPGLVRDEASQGWRLLIAWNDLDGTPHEEGVPFELLAGEGSDLARTLAQGGMVLPPDAPSRKILLRYLCGAMPKVQARVRLVEALGWNDGAFVLPSGETIGELGEAVRFSGDVPGARCKATAGTLEDWKQGVARFAVGNPFLGFSIACAFAGPMLALLRPDGGGGFNLQGRSSQGKSTGLVAALSTWGNPLPLPTWRATGNGLEGIAAARNDGFLALDELSQVDAKEAGSVAYMLANGSAKARMTKEGGSRPIRQWKLIFLSNGEVTLEDKVTEDGKQPRARAGQEVRLVDIPCPDSGLFTELHGFPGGGELAEHIKAQAGKHYGHAIRTFLEHISEAWPRRGELVTRLKAMESAWLVNALPPHVDGQVRRVALRFALVAVAGELAQRMGILPWPENEASRAASVCFKAWLDRRGFSGASEVHRGIEAVLTFLERNGQARFDEWGDRDARIINRAGTKRRTEGPVDGWDYLLTPSAWKEACAGFSSSSVARACVDAGILEPGPDGNPSRSMKIPGQGKVRVYVVRAAGIARSMGDVEAEAMCS